MSSDVRPLEEQKLEAKEIKNYWCGATLIWFNRHYPIEFYMNVFFFFPFVRVYNSYIGILTFIGETSRL